MKAIKRLGIIPWILLLLIILIAGIVIKVRQLLKMITLSAPSQPTGFPSWLKVSITIVIIVIITLLVIGAIKKFFKKAPVDESTPPAPATPAKPVTVIKKTPLWVSMIGYGLGFIFIGGALYVFFYLALAIRTEGWHFIESVPYPTETTVIDNYPSFETLHYGRHYLAKKGRYKFLMAGSSQQSTLPEYYFTPEDRRTTTFHYFKLGYEKEVFWSYKVTRVDGDSVRYKTLENHNDGSGGWIKIKPDHDGYVIISEGPNPH